MISPTRPGPTVPVTRPTFPTTSSVMASASPQQDARPYRAGHRLLRRAGSEPRADHPVAATRIRAVAPPPSTRIVGEPGTTLCGITWNSRTFTPDAGSATVVRNGMQTRSLQNDATQRFGSPAAARATVLPGVPATTSRYLYVLATEPGRSGPVHGESESAVFPAGCATSSATVASCASSRYIA